MYHFGRVSQENLATCCSELSQICMIVIRVMDIHVSCGHRSNSEQERAFVNGASTKHGGQSKHNTWPSQAVDLDPYPVNYKDIDRYKILAGIVFGVAACLGYKVRWGGDWDMDFNLANEKGKLRDFAHFEIVGG